MLWRKPSKSANKVKPRGFVSMNFRSVISQCRNLNGRRLTDALTALSADTLRHKSKNSPGNHAGANVRLLAGKGVNRRGSRGEPTRSAMLGEKWGP